MLAAKSAESTRVPAFDGEEAPSEQTPSPKEVGFRVSGLLGRPLGSLNIFERLHKDSLPLSVHTLQSVLMKKQIVGSRV